MSLYIICIHAYENNLSQIRGGVKNVVLLGGGGRWGEGFEATTFGQKSTTFYFCIHSKPSKRVKTQ